ncbi:uncharacterized protein OCT59_004708 [Rhizophagus irregularis]|nr:hypothetical protein OCT59_004708 [Rhizophagus irregularis]
MSSYKTDAKSGKPIKYLQDTKKALWERFAEEYPNGMRHTSFMTCLEGGQYVYRENLGGLCSTCNDCDYLVFGDIGVIISAHVMDEPLKKHLLTKSQELRRYIRREYSKELEVTAAVTCSKCESIFSFFEELKAAMSEEYFEILDEYQQKLIAWMAHHARKTYLNIHVRTNLEELDEEGAVMIVDYKMRILPQSAHETKTEFFGKRGWSFHSVLVYTKNMEQNQLDVQVFDHWSNDTCQDAWFTASSLHTVIETLNPKPKWVTIMSDNGMHYHCTELMLIIAHWKEWYNIIPRKWIFLEAGEAKTLIDSHHAQVSQAMKRYVKLGYDVISGDDIELAVKGIAGIQVSNLNPNRDNDKAKLGTITGISNLQEWTWPTDKEKVGYIHARALPGIGEWKEWSLEKIEKIVKKRKIEKPNPTFTSHTQSIKQWNIPILNKENKQDPTQSESRQEYVNQILSDLTNLENNRSLETKSQQTFTSGWALKKNKKTRQRGPVKRISPQVKYLLESMFHTGTANPCQKLNAQQMHEELLKRAELGEIEENDIPKVTTITNWISTFSRKWKEAMALRTLEENMDSENS